LGCSEQGERVHISSDKTEIEVTKVHTPVITIDTTKSGEVGEAESTITIETRIDSVLVEKITNYWNTKNELLERFEYFDSLGLEYLQKDFTYWDSNYYKSFDWFDLNQERIMKIDSTFNKNGSRIKKIEKHLGSIKITDSYNSKGNYIIKRQILSDAMQKLFVEQGGKFYYKRYDMPISSDWIPTTSIDFGYAMNLVIEAEKIALKKVNERVEYKSRVNY